MKKSLAIPAGVVAIGAAVGAVHHVDTAREQLETEPYAERVHHLMKWIKGEGSIVGDRSTYESEEVRAEGRYKRFYAGKLSQAVPNAHLDSDDNLVLNDDEETLVIISEVRPRGGSDFPSNPDMNSNVYVSISVWPARPEHPSGWYPGLSPKEAVALAERLSAPRPKQKQVARN